MQNPSGATPDAGLQVTALLPVEADRVPQMQLHKRDNGAGMPRARLHTVHDIAFTSRHRIQISLEQKHLVARRHGSTASMNNGPAARDTPAGWPAWGGAWDGPAIMMLHMLHMLHMLL